MENGMKMKGAEATLEYCDFAGIPAVRKTRTAKAYRPPELDGKIRASRTKVEARLLAKAKWAAVNAPHVLEVLPFSITMTHEDGKMLHDEIAAGRKIDAAVWRKAGAFLARLHLANIVHGDYTPANLMMRDEKEGKKGDLLVIDFGLGFISHDKEDYATDVLTMKMALHQKEAKSAFLEGYAREEKKLGHKKSILPLVEEMETRGRYRQRKE